MPDSEFTNNKPLSALIDALWAISLICAIYLSIACNRVVLKIFSASIALMSFDVLLSIIWDNDLNRAPREFCIAQGLVLQFTSYTASIAALCFAWQSYRLVVLKTRNSSTFNKWIYSLIIAYSILMTSIITSLSIGSDAIHVRALSCDVTTPWVRLVGYAGTNLLVSIPGVYWSGRAAWVVFSHSERTLRTFSALQQENQIQIEKNKCNSIFVNMNINNSSTQNQSNRLTQGMSPKKTYKLTRKAAIRMACFSTGLLVISLIASVNTWILVFSNSQPQSDISGNDVAGSLVGIVVFFIFGTTEDSNILKKCFRKRKIEAREDNDGM
ncbi:hypothetical protein F8M41_003275 [Gigaspora margarita]|uniref:Uncharacterized protein n=1 Tax=Gigaspora margarita TaxID=4874 RepID=A0A8H3XBH0_GIGMA|nr:hypothetical protein F8M41_003275 [Gigaspora margarita]